MIKKPIVDVDFEQTGNRTFCCFRGSVGSSAKQETGRPDQRSTLAAYDSYQKKTFSSLLKRENKFKRKWLMDSFEVDYESEEHMKIRKAVDSVIKGICKFDRELSSDDESIQNYKKDLKILRKHKPNAELLITNWFEMNGVIATSNQNSTTSRFFFKGKAEEFISYCHHKK